MTYPKPVIAGENSIIVYIGDTVDANNAVILSMIDRAVKEKFAHAILDTVPSYISILITYDYRVVGAQDIIDFVRSLDLSQNAKNTNGKTIEIPVCYDRRCGADIDDLLASNGITHDEMIELHSTPSYVVQAVGFIPGQPFLGPVHEKLIKGRHQKPRAQVPAGSVGIAGIQTGIYPVASAGGWQLIGRTPMSLQNDTFTTAEDIAVAVVGDVIVFQPIDFDTYLAMGGEIGGDL